MPETVDLFGAQKAAAIQDAEEMRNTHLLWVRYLRQFPAFPNADIVGDIAHHELCIEQYDRIIHVLNYSVAPDA